MQIIYIPSNKMKFPNPFKRLNRAFSKKTTKTSGQEATTEPKTICITLNDETTCKYVEAQIAGHRRSSPTSSKSEEGQVAESGIIAWKDTVPFVFPISEGQVIKVYDGDTITIASKLPYPESPLYRLSVRLNGIDTPEIKGKSEDEKLAAKNARDALANLIYGKQIRLENVQSEKYGRILADVYLGELHLNRWLINNRYAVAYDGGTKKAPISWLKYKESGEI